MSISLSKTDAISYIESGGSRIVMDRRSTRIGLIIFLTALAVGVLPVIPVGEVLAPERSGVSSATSLREESPPSASLVAPHPVSPVADASTIEKLRHLFSR